MSSSRFAHAEAAHYFSLADLPGLGERPALDREYIALYQDALEMTHAVLYFLRADQHDYAIDEWAFFAAVCRRTFPQEGHYRFERD